MTIYQTFFNVDPQEYFNQNYHLIQNIIDQDFDNIDNLIDQKLKELAKRYCNAYSVREETEYRDIVSLFQTFYNEKYNEV